MSKQTSKCIILNLLFSTNEYILQIYTMQDITNVKRERIMLC